MKIQNLSNRCLLETLTSLVQEERRLTLEILKYLREVEHRRLYAHEGYPSLFEFCTRHLHYSEGSSQRRISAMRLLRELPELEEKISDGALKLSVVAQAQSFFKKEEIQEVEAKREILTRLEHQSTRQAERLLQAQSTTPPKAKIEISPEILDQARELQALLSHKRLSLDEALGYALKLALEKHRPKEPKNPPPAPAVKPPERIELPAVKPTRYIPVETKRQVDLRDQGRCTYANCQSRHLLQYDHIIPYAHGGPTTPENLRLRCATHNRLEAEKSGLYDPNLHTEGL